VARRVRVASAAMRTSLVVWLALFGLWQLLVGSLTPAEIAGGVLGASIATIGVHVVRTRDDKSFIFRPGYFGVLLRRLPRQVIVDCARVLGLLFAPGRLTRGRIVRVPFDSGRADDAADAGRRALVVAGASLAPNVVAVRIEPPDLVVHQLIRDDALPQDREWPL
jgi:multisubunit Na+/H+ antiporter MnhE subunit